MKITKIKSSKTWKEVLNNARSTVNKAESNKEPSSSWKKKILMSEHSPIRSIIIGWKWNGIKSWVSTHFVRHWLGIEHFVGTSRTDRTGVDRDELKQSNLISHKCNANAQSIINISRVRLCKQASKETREAWELFLLKLEPIEPELVLMSVPNCIYRNGLCPEFNCCGYNRTDEFEYKLRMYLSEHKLQINKHTNIFLQTIL